MSDYGLLALTLLCLSLMGGLCIYLAINLVRGVRVDDHQLVRLISDTKYMLAELSSIGRTLRARPVTNTPTGENSPDGGAHEAASESAFDQFQQNGFQDISSSSMDANQLLQEFSQLKGKELATWKDANQARLDKLLADQAALHDKLVAAQEMLDAANQNIRQLRSKNTRLAGADVKVKALEGIAQSLESELHTAKSVSNKLNSELTLARQEAEEWKNKLHGQEARFKELHDAFVRDRELLEAEKNALELRLHSLQKAFDESVLSLNTDGPLKEVHEKFMQERQSLETDKIRLEEKLHQLQESFDRTLVEKAFIESAFLEMDTPAASAPASAPASASTSASVNITGGAQILELDT